MGTVDIEQTVEEVMQSDNLYWDGENPSYEEVEKIVGCLGTRRNG